MKKLQGKKTYLTAVAACLVSAGLFLQGEMALGEAVSTATAALMGIFIRKGIKSDTGAEDA